PRDRPRRRAGGARRAGSRPGRERAARRGRRDRARAGALPGGLRRRPPRGPRARHRGRRGDPDPLLVRFRAVSDQTIETIFTEERRYPPPPEFAALAVARPDIYEREFEEFWESEGR